MEKSPSTVAKQAIVQISKARAWAQLAPVKTGHFEKACDELTDLLQAFIEEAA